MGHNAIRTISAPHTIAAALTEAAKALHSPQSLEDTLDTIAQTALLSLPGFDHVGISISHRDGKIETMSGTDRLVWELDDLQYSLGEGPCVDSVQSAPVVLVEHARHDQRWPRYMPGAVQRGLRSQLALRLFTEKETRLHPGRGHRRLSGHDVSFPIGIV